MADFTTPLPDTAAEGADTHVADHNALTEALQELRTVVDALDTRVTDLEAAASEPAA